MGGDNAELLFRPFCLVSGVTVSVRGAINLVGFYLPINEQLSKPPLNLALIVVVVSTATVFEDV